MRAVAPDAQTQLAHPSIDGCQTVEAVPPDKGAVRSGTPISTGLSFHYAVIANMGFTAKMLNLCIETNGCPIQV